MPSRHTVRFHLSSFSRLPIQDDRLRKVKHQITHSHLTYQNPEPRIQNSECKAKCASAIDARRLLACCLLAPTGTASAFLMPFTHPRISRGQLCLALYCGRRAIISCWKARVVNVDIPHHTDICLKRSLMEPLAISTAMCGLKQCMTLILLMPLVSFPSN